MDIWIYLLLVSIGVGVGIALTRARFGSRLRTVAHRLSMPVTRSAISQIEEIARATERTRAELGQLRDEYRLLTTNLAAAVVMRDVSGTITFCSPFVEVLTGYPLQRFAAKESGSADFLETIVHSEDRERYQRAMGIARTGESFQFRYRILHQSGIELWVETRIGPILQANGALSGTLAVTLDITGPMRYQRQVEERNRDLQDFTYMVSHDLKAPLFTIKGMTEILREDLGATLTPEIQETLTHIADASKRLEQLVGSVLEYARISSSEQQSLAVDTKSILEEVLNDFTSQIAECAATVELPTNPPVVLGERLRIYQVFSNLLGNALKYRAPGRQPQIHIEAVILPLACEASFTVRDNGLGIPADRLDQIFRPFHRAYQGTVEGSGIGLACVKKIVERSGGTISVESTLEEGSAFRFTLPLAANESRE